MNSNHAVIAIPTTKVVFPLTSDGKKFDCGLYTPARTDGRVSFEEISQFLAELEAVKPSQPGTSIGCFIFASLLLFLLWICKLVIQVKADVDLVSFIIIFAVVFLASIITIVVARSKKSKNGTKAECLANCQAVVERYNQNFASRGLRWCLPADFPKRVELWKDYLQNQNQGAFMPLVNQQHNSPAQNYGVPNQNYQGHVNNNIYHPPSQF